MLVNKNENILIVTQENESIKDLINIIEEAYNTYKNDNLIINLSTLEHIDLSDIIEFLSLSNTHRGAKKSFVLVSSKVDLDTVPDEICVVPTLQEAYDIIEMEEIERDLGF